MSNSEEIANGVANIMAEHKAQDVVILDLREVAGWTDYFVIGTCTSSVHLKGVSRYVEEYLSEHKSGSINKPNPKEDERWILHDTVDVIIHIMDAQAREFYELEKLWYKAKATKVALNP
ncbi:MAG: ribosome-associated protein [Spirochaetes bacterium]|nr:MAG: ribosome-associated protein [Spirochaetota bacterium]